MKYFVTLIWIIASLKLITVAMSMLSAANDVENLVGVLIVFFIIYLSIKSWFGVRMYLYINNKIKNPKNKTK